MMIYLESLGCCRNQVDSEVMLGRLQSRGHEITQDPSQAHVIIVNTCGFISAASAEAVDTILDMARYKTEGNCQRLVVTGCLPERFKHDDIAGELPEVDAFVGIGAVDAIVDSVEQVSGPVRILLPDPCQRQFQGFPLPRRLTLDYSAYVKISEGCDRHCTYCIIPRLRGKQRSRVPEEVLAEVTALVDQGVREIILVGESTSDYGVDLPGAPALDGLLQELSRAVHDREPSPGSVWIRLLYTHPSSLTHAIIRQVASLDNVCSYYDVPVQHASSRILKRMGRGYSLEDLHDLFSFIRETDPDAVLRTTIITGFPGETDDDFQTLMSFIREIRFDHLGVFAYSDSDDLNSHRLGSHVPEDLAGERLELIMEEQARISEELNCRYMGETLQVLVEENTDDGLWLGRTRFQAPEVDGMTFIYGSGLEIGSVVDVKITETHEYDLAGDLYEAGS